MKKSTFSVFLLVVFASTLFSQSDKKQDAKEVPDFVKMQQEFNDWAKGKDLSKEKGWKYYKRWEEQMAKRANADGSLPDEYEYFKAAMDVAAQKQKNIYTRAASWIPVGPFVVPIAPGGSGLNSYGISRINTITFHPTDSSTYWVGVAQGGVWKTTNGGASYMPLTDNLPILRISDICVDPLRPDTMYISLCDFEYIGFALNANGSKRMTHYGMGVYKTTNGGQTWNPTGLAFNQTAYDGSLIRRVFVNSTNANSVLAAGTSGIWKSADGGTTWSKILDSLICDIERDPVNKNTLYASGGYISKTKKGSACILKSTDFGTTWTLLNTGIPKTTVLRIELAISPSDPNYVYALCCNTSNGLYGVYRTTNAGINWSQRCTTPNILGNSGNASGGQATYDLTIIVNATDRNTIYTGGLIIWGSSDGGTTMTQITDYGTIHPDQHFFAYNSLNKNYYMCNDGGIYKANPINIALNTTKWKRLSDGLQTPSYYRVNTSKNNPGFLEAGAQDNGSAYFNGKRWIFVYGGDGMDGSVDDNDTNIVIASSQFGDFAKSTNGGATVTSVTVTTTESGEWTTPIVRDPNNNSILYTGYTNVFKSTNGGTNWSSISNLSGPPITAIAVCPKNSNYIYVTKRVQGSTMAGAKAWMTSNGGTNWKDITAGLPDTLYFISAAVDDNDPNIAWITCGGFYNGVKIFQTTNGGSSWTNISYNLPNLPVNTVMKRAGTNELYVGCDVGVYKLISGQTSWQLFSNGLPNVIVSDLEIQYASQTMYASTFGRGIWSIDLSNITSVSEDPMHEAVISINPSLNNGEFQLSVQGLKAEKASFEIIDIMGRKVFSENIEVRSGSYSGNYSLLLNYGLYFAKVTVGNGISRVQKFVVK